jgi:hypothetical protein
MNIAGKYGPILGVLIVIGFFTLLGILSFIPIKEGNSDLLNIALGILGSGFMTVVNYYFGSSHGSKVKTDLLADKNNSVG